MLFRDELAVASAKYEEVLDILEEGPRRESLREKLKALDEAVLAYAAEPATKPRLHDAA